VNTSEVYTALTVLLLTFVRWVGFFVQAPIWGSRHIPKPVLVASAFIFSVLLYSQVPVSKAVEMAGKRAMEMDMFPLATLILSQFVVGLALGYISFIIMSAVQFGAELLDVQMGLSAAASFDPASHGAVNMIRRWAFYLAMIIYLLMNVHHLAMDTMRYSFEVIPLSGVPITKRVVMDMVEKTFLIFTLGLQIAAPIVASLFITQVALGLLARVAPQMNVFMLSFPLNIAIGMTLLAATIWDPLAGHSLMAERFRELFKEEHRWMVHMVKLLVPVHSGGG